MSGIGSAMPGGAPPLFVPAVPEVPALPPVALPDDPPELEPPEEVVPPEEVEPPDALEPPVPLPPLSPFGFVGSSSEHARDERPPNTMSMRANVAISASSGVFEIEVETHDGVFRHGGVIGSATAEVPDEKRPLIRRVRKATRRVGQRSTHGAPRFSTIAGEHDVLI